MTSNDKEECECGYNNSRDLFDVACDSFVDRVKLAIRDLGNMLELTNMCRGEMVFTLCDCMAEAVWKEVFDAKSDNLKDAVYSLFHTLGWIIRDYDVGFYNYWKETLESYNKYVEESKQDNQVAQTPNQSS